MRGAAFLINCEVIAMSTKKKTKKKTVQPVKKAAPQDSKAKEQKMAQQTLPTEAKSPEKKPEAAPSKKWVRPVLWVIIAVLALVLVFVILLWVGLANTSGGEDPTVPATAPTQQTPQAVAPTVDPMEQIVFEEVEELHINLGYGLEITDVGKYAGIYMEDGTDDFVTDVLMIVVTNTGEENIQYAEITMTTAAGDAFFTLSTLPAGESVVLLEKNRMVWSDEDYEFATMENTVLFTEELSLQEDKLQIQILDGAINVTNISGEAITGDIVIYYKNAAADLYYGGVTYRVRIEGGMAADEIKQIMASHFSTSGSKIMFVTVG